MCDPEDDDDAEDQFESFNDAMYDSFMGDLGLPEDDEE